MATTTLRTYHGNSMAEALAEVKKDLGADAVILHTRSYRVGGVLGVGTRTMVEITASADADGVRPKPLRPRPAPRPSAPGATQLQIAALAPTRAPAEGFIATPPWFEPRERPPAQVGMPPRLAEARAPAGAEPAPAEPRAPDADREKPSPSPAVRPAVPPIPNAARLSAGRFPPAPTTPKAQAALEEELAAIRRLVGQVLQSSRRAEARAAQSAGAVRGGEPGIATGPLFDLYMRLLDNQVSTEVADELASAVRDELTAEELGEPGFVREAMLRHLAKRIPVATKGAPPGRAQSGRPTVVALIGPTGVGKTTTVAKLAATYKLRYGRKVGLITADTYRIAAVEQLRTYADIVGLPLKVVLSPQDMGSAIDSLSACDVVLVDTAGRSQHDAARLDELAELLEAARPDASHLVLSLAAAESVIAVAADRFGHLGPRELILTKLDEAVDLGVIANIARRVALPLGYITTGQEVPDHIEPASADRLARLVLDGREARREPARVG